MTPEPTPGLHVERPQFPRPHAAVCRPRRRILGGSYSSTNACPRASCIVPIHLPADDRGHADRVGTALVGAVLTALAVHALRRSGGNDGLSPATRSQRSNKRRRLTQHDPTPTSRSASCRVQMPPQRHSPQRAGPGYGGLVTWSQSQHDPQQRSSGSRTQRRTTGSSTAPAWPMDVGQPHLRQRLPLHHRGIPSTCATTPTSTTCATTSSITPVWVRTAAATARTDMRRNVWCRTAAASGVPSLATCFGTTGWRHRMPAAPKLDFIRRPAGPNYIGPPDAGRTHYGQAWLETAGNVRLLATLSDGCHRMERLDGQHCTVQFDRWVRVMLAG